MSQPWILSAARARVRGDRVALGGDPADDDEHDEEAERDQGEQDDDGAAPARHAVALEPGHGRRDDHREDQARDHRVDDRRGRRGEHDEPDDERGRADEEPGGDPEVAQPARRREDRGELLELARVELHDLRLLVVARRLVPEPRDLHADACYACPQTEPSSVTLDKTWRPGAQPQSPLRPAAQTPAARFAPLEAKLEPPRRRPGLVARYSLVDRLRASAADPIVYVSAPAGYGKTTLMAHWADADSRPFAWVSLDDGDNDPVALLTYVALALNRVEPLGGPVFSALSAPQPAVDGVVLPRLGKAVATRSEPFVLVLDDAHVLTAPDALESLFVLMRHLPAGSQLAITARSEPTLPLGRLRAGRRLFELGPADLAFAPDEAELLLRGAGIQLEPAEVRLITERTEGWPAGLYLAALSLRGDASVAAAVEGFAGDDRLVADYFRDEVLARLSPSLARFLTRTSVLDRLSAPLCDAILEQTGSASKLHKLERSNLFLVPLDRQRVWYRYHTLFAEMLRSRLRDAEPELELELHERAGAWYAEHGEPEQAIRHALAAGNVARAGDLVWTSVPRYRGRGRGSVLLRWLSAFTDDADRRLPAARPGGGVGRLRGRERSGGAVDRGGGARLLRGAAVGRDDVARVGRGAPAGDDRAGRRDPDGRGRRRLPRGSKPRTARGDRGRCSWRAPPRA